MEVCGVMMCEVCVALMWCLIGCWVLGSKLWRESPREDTPTPTTNYVLLIISFGSFSLSHAKLGTSSVFLLLRDEK